MPYEKPKTVMIENVMGDTGPEQFRGYVEFTLNGQKLRLEPEQDGSELRIRLSRSDQRARDLRRGALPRYDDRRGWHVVLDFNEAYNPPCAYNPYTTCPLPQPENRLPVRIEAGEKSYHH